MTIMLSRDEHIALAARARHQVREETSEIARAIQLRIARLHEARVGLAPRRREQGSQPT
ncbi:MAG: hypothetical protein JWL96_2608 [Sphingomonas bacterium]|nr:hypothetical protein [Sphingomonas bacterium]